MYAGVPSISDVQPRHVTCLPTHSSKQTLLCKGKVGYFLNMKCLLKNHAHLSHYPCNIGLFFNKINVIETIFLLGDGEEGNKSLIENHQRDGKANTICLGG